jgi:hypothetical protein
MVYYYFSKQQIGLGKIRQLKACEDEKIAVLAAYLKLARELREHDT